MKNLLMLVFLAVSAAVSSVRGQIIVPPQGDGIFITTSSGSVGNGLNGFMTGMNDFSVGFYNPTTQLYSFITYVDRYDENLNTLQEVLFRFDTISGQTLSSGSTYNIGSSNDGIASLSIDGQASGTLTGSITFLDYRYGAIPTTWPGIAVDLYLVENNDPSKWIIESIRIGSSVPYTTSAIPEPTTYAAFAGATVLFVAFLKRRKSVQIQ